MPLRPSAYQVSFPEDAAEEQHLSNVVPTTYRSEPLTGKRKASADTEADKNEPFQRSHKRTQLLPVVYYEHPRNINLVHETAEYRAPGEDPDAQDNGMKPVRILSNFCIFDPAFGNKLVSLDALDIDDGQDRQFAAAGVVFLEDGDEEDYGQEDDTDPDQNAAEADHVRLNTVDLYPFDYFSQEPVYIETQHAYYELRGPSTRYNPFYLAFLTPRRVARLVIARVKARPHEDLQSFRAGAHDCTDEDLWDAIPYLQDAVDANNKLRDSPLIQGLLRRMKHQDGGLQQRACRRRGQARPLRRGFLGNPDLALLKAENQSPTHVTPLIAELANGYFEERLVVIGPRPIAPSKVEVAQREAKALQFLKECITTARTPPQRKIIHFPRGYQLKRPYAEQVEINGAVYKTGDFVVMRKGQHGRVPAPLLPPAADVPTDATLADYFWFARIIYLNMESEQAHVQWLVHGSQIILGEMAHPQELFLNIWCSNQPLHYIARKIQVEYTTECPRKPHVFFFKSIYTEEDASFTSVDVDEMNRAYGEKPPDNCVVCSRQERKNTDAEWQLLKDGSVYHGRSDADGIAYQGQHYHYQDFVLYINSTGGPAHIGYITHIKTPLSARGGLPLLHLRKVGRVGKDLSAIEPEENENPERHLLLTDEEIVVQVDKLIRVVFVLARDFFPQPTDLHRWIEYSPDHFFVTYNLPSLSAESLADSWGKRQEVTRDNLFVCDECCPTTYQDWRKRDVEFCAYQESQKYDCLDLFGGTGAFSQAAAEGSRGCLKPTHLIEITPSAAKTVQRNFKNIATYCQDANIVLRYFIKSNEKHNVEVPVQLFDNKTPLPPPIKPGKMRAIFAGLPCQSHSGLNMYRKAEDPKSNLILNAASYVDFFRPEFFFLENVPGFLKYNLLAKQASQHRVEGGVEMGGLKLLLRALLDMKYQIRFALLQAGNYGAPQSRVRFFLVAARHDQPLPEMPQPTHDFEVVHQLKVALPYGEKQFISPIRTATGTAPHASVSIEDAIGDLPMFDWRHPDRKNAPHKLRLLYDQRRRKDIVTLVCDRDKNHCGLEGAVEYQHEPRTSYQMQARARPTENIQHFTRCLLPRTVERVVTIPLEAGADYRSLPENLHEWQFASPASAVGRGRFRGGLYGRLDKSSYFPTTVTNMHPTAKQSRVLHPYCLRMVTVRELARSQGFPDWFVFVSINENVVTIHRQIGNAVPWQVSRALGRELGTALFKKWKEKKLATEPVAEDVDMH